MKFGLIAKYGSEEADAIAKDLAEYISKKGDIVVEAGLGERIGIAGQKVPLDEMSADVVVAVGGDGTIFRAVQQARGKVLGVNVGRIGFLAECMPENAKECIDKVIEGDYVLDRRGKLATELSGVRLPDAMNEAVVHTSQISKMRHFRVIIDEEPAEEFRADGVIIATPTGSTGYALSAGGPIVDPRVNCFIVAPIAPFKLSARPLVVPSDAKIRLESCESRSAVIVIDGQYQRDIDRPEVSFFRSEVYAEFIRFKPDFYSRISRLVV